MSKNKLGFTVNYDRVYVWKEDFEAWEQVECQDDFHVSTLRDRLIREGYCCVRGKSSIGPPEGPPSEAIRKIVAQNG